MKKADTSIKMKPRAVRGRVLKGFGHASKDAAQIISDRVRIVKRQMEVRPQESKPEGDAVSNVQEEMERSLEQVPRVAYRLTRAQIEAQGSRAL